MKKSASAPLGLTAEDIALLGFDPDQPHSRSKPRPATVNLPRGTGANPILLREKTRLATEQADKLALANARIRGELVNAAEVEREWADMLRQTRAALLALPGRVQQRLAHLTVHDIAVLDREVRDVLTELGNASAAVAVDAHEALGGTGGSA